MIVGHVVVCDEERVPWHDNDGPGADRRARAHLSEPRSRRNGVDDDDS